jgi:hypothetical protein
VSQICAGNYPNVLSTLKFGQEIVRNWLIKRHVVELGVPLGSGVEAEHAVRSDVRVIFHDDEARELEYPPGAIFL